jgi:hypothetical protein
MAGVCCCAPDQLLLLLLLLLLLYTTIEFELYLIMPICRPFTCCAVLCCLCRCVVLLCFILGLPMLHSYVAFAAITSIGVVGLYTSYLVRGGVCCFAVILQVADML